jgi:hypothetical protein
VFESVFLFLHFSDFLVESIGNVIDFFLLLFFFINKFNLSDLGEFSVDFGRLLLGILSNWKSHGFDVEFFLSIIVFLAVFFFSWLFSSFALSL